MTAGRGAKRGAGNEAATGQPRTQRHCDGCDAALLGGREAEAVPLRWGEVWWCEQCVRTLSTAEIERQTRELPLRGIPMN